MRRGYLDIESRSTLSLKDVGSYRYAEDPSTIPLCIYYAIDDGPVQPWWVGWPLPECFLAEDIVYVSHNNQFDRVFFDRHIRKTRIEQWDDTMIRCLYYGLPAALEDVCSFLFNEKKDPRGGTLITNIQGKGVCLPQRKSLGQGKGYQTYWNNDPSDLRDLGEYCGQDVHLLRRLDKAVPPIPLAEIEAWRTWERMNDYGVAINVEFCKIANAILAERQIQFEADLERITNGEITSSGQIERIVKYVNRRMRAPVDKPLLPNCQADTLIEFLGRNNPPSDVLEVLRVRQESNSAAVKKYQAGVVRSCSDDRVRGSQIYYGAHTGRGSSQGFQLHNNKRGKEAEYKVFCEALLRDGAEPYRGWVDWNYILSHGIRWVIQAKEGHTFIVYDYSGIEARMVDWLVGDLEGLEEYRHGVDKYRVLASAILGKPESEITKDERNMGKESRLSGQYGIAWFTYRKRLLKAWGVDISIEGAKLAIDTFRKKHWIIRDAWAQLKRAWQAACRGIPTTACRCTFSVENNWMQLVGPFGRSLFYYAPSYDMSYGIPGKTTRDKETSEVMPLRKHNYGGAQLENIAQWCAGVLARDDMVEIDKLRLTNFCFMVHDENISECRIEDVAVAQPKIEAIMTAPKWWCPELPVDVEGWVGPNYKKG